MLTAIGRNRKYGERERETLLVIFFLFQTCLLFLHRIDDAFILTKSCLHQNFVLKTNSFHHDATGKGIDENLGGKTFPYFMHKKILYFFFQFLFQFSENVILANYENKEKKEHT